MSAIRYNEAEGRELLERAAARKNRNQSATSRDSGPRGQPSPGGVTRASLLELRLAQQIAEAGLPEPVREYFHIPGRDFRLDFAWPAAKIGVEIQGMQHRVKGRFHADIEKRALGLLAGWRILEIDGRAVKSGQGIDWLRQLLGAASPQPRGGALVATTL